MILLFSRIVLTSTFFSLSLTWVVLRGGTGLTQVVPEGCGYQNKQAGYYQQIVLIYKLMIL